MPMNTLPPEIWLLVKDSIPLSDMRTHVSFYQAASRFAALYDTVADPDAFWEDVCTMCAIGRFPDEHPSVRSWKDIAVECITVDGFCEGSSKHPCGEVLLQRNRDMMRECALRTHKAAVAGEPAPIETNKLLRRDYYGDLAPEVDKKLHPLCARSYATFPGIKHCVADGDWGRELRSSKLQSDYAITVHDVLRAIQADIAEPLRVGELLEYLEDHEHCALHALSYRGVRGTLDRLRTLGDVLATCYVKEVRVVDCTQVPNGAYNIMFYLK
ncbi:hypothetical protein TRAPUB_1979 [Trametes pubescens]|uniref:Uncharacterized protein n=1 Tax=Trametes pubescens TaxID=154538 RepID=A0A1M2VHT5_TRAPU|nr:hypothetical protein TRAPUB_1979 [Trametes pubescens]